MGSRGLKAATLAGVLLLIVSLACNLGQTKEQPETIEPESGGVETQRVEAFVRAAEGGTVEHPAGAILTIGPESLDQDTIVAITGEGFNQPSEETQTPLLAISPDFKLDFGGASFGDGEAIELSLVLPESDQLEIRPSHATITQRDARGNIWLRAAHYDPETNSLSQTLSALADDPSGLAHSSSPTGQLASLQNPAPKSDLGSTFFGIGFMPMYESTESQGKIGPLQVPYYIQDGLAWCTPTALSMMFSYHGEPYGITENWSIAGMAGQDRNSAEANFEVIDWLNLPEEDYEFLWWDGELVDWPQGRTGSNTAFLYRETFFTSYVKWQLAGMDLRAMLGPTVTLSYSNFEFEISTPDVTFPPRPVQTTADEANHAFVIVGADEDSVWTHDSSGAVGGRRPADKLSWEDFKEEAFVNSDNLELSSVVYHGLVRPENERRGSIILGHQQKSDSSDDQSSLIYTAPSLRFPSFWRWDGDPYDKGYYWDDPLNEFANDPIYGNSLPIYGQRFGELKYTLWIANITESSHDFEFEAELRAEDGGVISRYSESLSLDPLSWKDNELSGRLDTSNLTKPGSYEIHFLLHQNGVLQDHKVVGFTATQEPSLPASLHIVRPEEDQEFQEGDSIPFSAEITDFNRNEDEYQITWTYPRHDGVPYTFGTSRHQEEFQYDRLCDGEYLITATARSLSAGETLEDSVSILVSDLGSTSPPPQCAPSISIDRPTDGGGYTTGESLLLQASIDDDHPETNSPIYPVIWRLGGPSGSIIARGLQGSTKLGEGQHRIHVEYGAASDQVTIQAGQNKLPAVSIDEPDSGESFQAMGNVPVTFRGHADDPEDGALSGDALEWSYKETSSADDFQFAGTGEQVTITFSGSCNWVNYTVRLQAIDSDGGEAFDEITISARGPIC